MDTDPAWPAHNRVRLIGFEVCAFDRGYKGFDEPGLYSELLVTIHRPGTTYGVWQFEFLPGRRIRASTASRPAPVIGRQRDRALCQSASRNT